jgi:DivIVA domain-containing protein
MAFTPEDVLNKHFTATQFRRGYDEQEVDDFLDEIVVELRRLSTDNDDLGAQLKTCQESKGLALAKPAVVHAAAASVGVRAESAVRDDKLNGAAETPAAKNDDDVARSRAAVAGMAAAERQAQDKISAAKVSAEQAEKDASARISKAKTDAEQAEAQAAERVKAAKDAKDAADNATKEAKDAKDAADKATKEAKDSKEATDKSAKSSLAAPALAVADTKGDGHIAAAGVLALAQKLHEEYVFEGQSTRERLIGEGQAHHDKLVGEATAKHADLLSTGQAKHDEFLSIGQAKHAEFLSIGQSKHDSLIAEASARHEQMITEARERSTGMVAEAQQKKAAVLQALARERDLLEKKIDELRTFERDYRARLKSYLESQLKELDHTGVDKAADGEGDGNVTHDNSGNQ